MEATDNQFSDPVYRTEYFEKIFSTLHDSANKLDSNDVDWEFEINKLEKISYDEELTDFVKDIHKIIPDLFYITVKHAFLGRTFVLLLTIFHTYCALPTDQRESFAPFIDVFTSTFHCIVFFYIKYPDWFDNSFFPYLQALCKFLIQMMNIIRVLTLPTGVRLNQETTFFYEPSFEFLPKFYHMHYLWILLQDIYYIFLIFQEETSKIGKAQKGKSSVEQAVIASEYNRVFQQFAKSLEHSVMEWEEYFYTLQESLQQYPVNLSPLLPNYATASSSSSSSTPPCSILATFTSIPLYDHIYHHYLHQYMPNTRLWILDHLESWRVSAKETFYRKHVNGEPLRSVHDQKGRLFWLQAPKGAGKSTILAAYIQQVLTAYTTTANFSLLQLTSLSATSFPPGKTYVRTAETIVLYAFLSCPEKRTNPVHHNVYNQQTIDERCNIVRDVLQSISVQLLQYYPILLPSFLPIVHAVTNQMTDLFTPYHHNTTRQRLSPILQSAHELIPSLPSYPKIVYLIELFINGILNCPYICPEKILIVIDDIDCIHDARQLSILYTLIVNFSQYFRVIVSSTLSIPSSSSSVNTISPIKRAYRINPVKLKRDDSVFTINRLLAKHLSIQQKYASPYYQEDTNIPNEFQSFLQLPVEFPIEHYVMVLDSYATEYIQEDMMAYLLKQFQSLLANPEADGKSITPQKTTPRYLNPTMCSPYNAQKITMNHIQAFLQNLVPTFLQKYKHVLPMHFVIFLASFPVFRSLCKEIILKGIKESQALNCVHNKDEDIQKKLTLFFKKEIMAVLGNYKQQLPIQASQQGLPSTSTTEGDIDEAELYTFYLKQYKKKFTVTQWERIMSILGILVYAYAPMTIEMVYELLALQLPGHGGGSNNSHTHYHAPSSGASHHSGHQSIVSDMSSKQSQISNISTFHTKQSNSPPAKPFVFGMASYRNKPTSPTHEQNDNSASKSVASNGSGPGSTSSTSAASRNSQHSYFSFNSQYTSHTQGTQQTPSGSAIQKNKNSIVDKSHLFVDYKTVHKHIKGDLSPLLYLSVDPHHQHVEYVEFCSQHFKKWFKNPLLNKEFYVSPNHVHQQYFLKAALPLLEFQSHILTKSTAMLTSILEEQQKKPVPSPSVNQPKTPIPPKTPLSPVRNKSPTRGVSSIPHSSTRKQLFVASPPSILKELANREARKLSVQASAAKTPQPPKTPTVGIDLSNYSFAKPTTSSASKVVVDMPQSKTPVTAAQPGKKPNDKFEKTRSFFEKGDKSPTTDGKTQVTGILSLAGSASQKFSPHPVILFYLLNYFLYHLGAAGQYEDCLVFYTLLSWNIGIIARKGVLGLLHDIEILYNQLTASLDIVVQQLDKSKTQQPNLFLQESKDILMKYLQEIKHLYGFFLYLRKCCPQFVHKFGVEDVHIMLGANILQNGGYVNEDNATEKKPTERAAHYQYYVMCHQFCVLYIHYYHFVIQQADKMIILKQDNIPKSAEKVIPPPPPPARTLSPTSPRRKAGTPKQDEPPKKVPRESSKVDATRDRMVHLKRMLSECTQWLQSYGFLHPMPSIFSTRTPAAKDSGAIIGTPLSASKDRKRITNFSASIGNTVCDSLVNFSSSGSLMLFRSKSTALATSPRRLQRTKSLRTKDQCSEDDFFLWSVSAQRIMEYYVNSYFAKYQHLYCTDDSLLGVYTTFSGVHTGLITVEIWDSIYQGQGKLIQMISTGIANPIACMKFLNSFYLFLQDNEANCMLWNYFTNDLFLIPNAIKQKELVNADQVYVYANSLVILCDRVVNVMKIQEIDKVIDEAITSPAKSFSLCCEGIDVTFVSRDFVLVGTLDCHIYFIDLKTMTSTMIYKPTENNEKDVDEENVAALQSVCYSPFHELLFVAVSREVRMTSILVFSFTEHKALVHDPHISKILNKIGEVEVDFKVNRMKPIDETCLLFVNDTKTVYWQYEVEFPSETDEESVLEKSERHHKNTLNVLSFICKNSQLFNKPHSYRSMEKEYVQLVQFIDDDHIFEVTSGGYMMIWNIPHNVCVRQLTRGDYIFEGCKIIPVLVDSQLCHVIITWQSSSFNTWLFSTASTTIHKGDLKVTEDEVSFSCFSIVSLPVVATSSPSLNPASLDETNHVKFKDGDLALSAKDKNAASNVTLLEGKHFILAGTLEGQILIYDFITGNLLSKQPLLHEESIINLLPTSESKLCNEKCHFLVSSHFHAYRMAIQVMDCSSVDSQLIILMTLDVMKYPLQIAQDDNEDENFTLCGFFHVVPSNPLITSEITGATETENCEKRFIIDRVISVWNNIVIGWDQLQTETLIISQLEENSNDNVEFPFVHHHIHYPANQMDLMASSSSTDDYIPNENLLKNPNIAHYSLSGHKQHPLLPMQHGVHNPLAGSYHAALPFAPPDDSVTSQVAIYKVIPPPSSHVHSSAFRVHHAELITIKHSSDVDDKEYLIALHCVDMHILLVNPWNLSTLHSFPPAYDFTSYFFHTVYSYSLATDCISSISNPLNVWEYSHVHGRRLNWTATGNYLLEYDPVLHNYTVHKIAKEKLQSSIPNKLEAPFSPGDVSQNSLSPSHIAHLNSQDSAEKRFEKPPLSPIAPSPGKLLTETNKWLSAFSLFLQTDRQETIMKDDGRFLVLLELYYLPFIQSDIKSVEEMNGHLSSDAHELMEMESLFPSNQVVQSDEKLLLFSTDLLRAAPKNDEFRSEPSPHLLTFLQPFVVPIVMSKKGHRSLAPLTSFTPNQNIRKQLSVIDTATNETTPRQELKSSKIPRRIPQSTIKSTEKDDMVQQKHVTEVFPEIFEVTATTDQALPSSIENDMNESSLECVDIDIKIQNDTLFTMSSLHIPYEVNDSSFESSSSTKLKSPYSQRYLFVDHNMSALHIPHEVNNSPHSSPRPRIRHEMTNSSSSGSADVEISNKELPPNNVNNLLNSPFETNEGEISMLKINSGDENVDEIEIIDTAEFQRQIRQMIDGDLENLIDEFVDSSIDDQDLRSTSVFSFRNTSLTIRKSMNIPVEVNDASMKSFVSNKDVLNSFSHSTDRSQSQKLNNMGTDSISFDINEGISTLLNSDCKVEVFEEEKENFSAIVVHNASPNSNVLKNPEVVPFNQHRSYEENKGSIIFKSTYNDGSTQTMHVLNSDKIEFHNIDAEKEGQVYAPTLPLSSELTVIVGENKKVSVEKSTQCSFDEDDSKDQRSILLRRDSYNASDFAHNNKFSPSKMKSTKDASTESTELPLYSRAILSSTQRQPFIPDWTNDVKRRGSLNNSIVVDDNMRRTPEIFVEVRAIKSTDDFSDLPNKVLTKVEDVDDFDEKQQAREGVIDFNVQRHDHENDIYLNPVLDEVISMNNNSNISTMISIEEANCSTVVFHSNDDKQLILHPPTNKDKLQKPNDVFHRPDTNFQFHTANQVETITSLEILSDGKIVQNIEDVKEEATSLINDTVAVDESTEDNGDDLILLEDVKIFQEHPKLLLNTQIEENATDLNCMNKVTNITSIPGLTPSENFSEVTENHSENFEHSTEKSAEESGINQALYTLHRNISPNPQVHNCFDIPNVFPITSNDCQVSTLDTVADTSKHIPLNTEDRYIFTAEVKSQTTLAKEIKNEEIEHMDFKSISFNEHQESDDLNFANRSSPSDNQEFSIPESEMDLFNVRLEEEKLDEEEIGSNHHSRDDEVHSSPKLFQRSISWDNSTFTGSDRNFIPVLSIASTPSQLTVRSVEILPSVYERVIEELLGEEEIEDEPSVSRTFSYDNTTITTDTREFVPITNVSITSTPTISTLESFDLNQFLDDTAAAHKLLANNEESQPEESKSVRFNEQVASQLIIYQNQSNSHEYDEVEQELELYNHDEKEKTEGIHTSTVAIMLPTFRRSVSWDNSTFTGSDRDFIPVLSIASTPSQLTVRSVEILPSVHERVIGELLGEEEEDMNGDEDEDHSVARTLSYDNTTITTDPREFVPISTVSVNSTPTIGTIESFDFHQADDEGMEVNESPTNEFFHEDDAPQHIIEVRTPMRPFENETDSPRIPFMIPMSTTTIMSELLTPDTTLTHDIYPSFLVPSGSSDRIYSDGGGGDISRSLSHSLPDGIQLPPLQLSSTERGNIHRFLDHVSRKERRRRRMFLSILYGVPELQLDSDDEQDSEDDDSEESDESDSDDDGEIISGDLDNAWLTTPIDSMSVDDTLQQPPPALPMRSSWVGAVSPYYLGFYQQVHQATTHPTPTPGSESSHPSGQEISPASSTSPQSQASTPRVFAVHGPGLVSYETLSSSFSPTSSCDPLSRYGIAESLATPIATNNKNNINNTRPFSSRMARKVYSSNSKHAQFPVLSSGSPLNANHHSNHSGMKKAYVPIPAVYARASPDILPSPTNKNHK